MNRRLMMLLVMAAALTGLVIFGITRNQTRAVEASADVVVALSGANAEGFTRATSPRQFTFPADHGAHPDFQTEWWYFTGNLAASDGRRYGYELSLFRRALTPTAPARASEWAFNQIYFGDFALTDVANDAFYFTPRFTRGAADLAGAVTAPRVRIWIEDWSVTTLDDQASRWRLRANGDQYHIDLELTLSKPIVLQGDNGLSHKGSTLGNASYYYSISRLHTQGIITIAGQTVNVTGDSWMDREFSTSSLEANAQGWDWFALQLDNNREIMLYYIRLKDGSAAPSSQGALIEPDGSKIALSLSNFSIRPTSTWTSPRTGTVYPSGWHVSIQAPSGPIELDITPLVKGQELNTVTAYWEGANRITGTDNNVPISGYGYVELTGYNTGTTGDAQLSK